MKFSVLPQSVGWFVEAYADNLLFFNTSNFQGRELSVCDFSEMYINIVMCQDTCEQICFKLCMILNTTKLYSLIAV